MRARLESLQKAWHLPQQGLHREVRDTLWLLLMLALVLAPHVPHLPWWSSAGACMALLWRARLACLQAPLPSKGWLIFMLLALLALTWLTHGTLIGRQAGLTLVVVLATLKSLELKAKRDALVCMYLGFFLVFTQFLYSQGIGTALLMLLSVWGLLCALILGQRPLGYPSMREVGGQALRATLWGIPLMATLFLLFPRIGPLWSLPDDTQTSTGLSDSMTLGDVAALSRDDRIALRIKFLSTPPPAKQLYFRGPTLGQFDGKQWTASKMPPMEASQLGGQSIPYLMTVEPSALQVLPLLEGTGQAQVIQPATALPLQRHGLQWSHQQTGKPRMQVNALAYTTIAHGPRQADASLSPWLYLPPHANPRTRQWAQHWAQTLGDNNGAAAPTWHTRDKVKALLRHIQQHDYRYTLSPGKMASSEHTIDTFWLDQQAGFCEHFASSFVMIMRVLNIPARIVTGYQGAELNPFDGLFVVRNSNAHAWAEVWIENEGWVRVDPTAAVAPERIERSPRLQPFAMFPGALGEMDPETLRRLRMTWEAIDHRWNQWVLQYSNEQQMKILQAWGWESPNWETLGQVLACALALLALGSALLARLRTGAVPKNAWHRLLARTDRALRHLSPALAHTAPLPASVWHAHLQQQWASVQPLQAEQQALLETLLDLDKARYGPPSSTVYRNMHPQAKALTQRIERLSKACKTAAIITQP